MLEVGLMSSRTVCAVASAVVLLACRQPEPLPSTDQPLAALERPMLGGATFSAATVAGKVVLVNFWSPT